MIKLIKDIMITGCPGIFIRCSNNQSPFSRGVIFFIILFTTWTAAKANKSDIPTVGEISVSDSFPGEARQPDSFRVAFDPDFKDRYKGREFQYKSTSYPWARRVWRYISRILEKIFGRSNRENADTADLAINILMLIIFLTALVTIIRLILGKDSFSLLFKREKHLKPAFAESGDMAINYSDLEKFISEAISHKNYRLALRYQYVILLKKLNEKGLLEYHPEKTDSDYLLELEDFSLKDLFRYIIYLYHRTWYGDYRINEMDYELAKQSFNQMHKKLQNG